MGGEIIVGAAGVGIAGATAVAELIRRANMPTQAQVDALIQHDQSAPFLVPNGNRGRGWVYRPSGPNIFSDGEMHRLASNVGVHGGLDIIAADGTPVSIAKTGVILWTGQRNGYGNMILAKHRGNMTTLYAHLSRIDVQPGQVVPGGRMIGLVGHTSDDRGGYTRFPQMGPHLHFSVHQGLPTVRPGSADERRYGTEPLAWLGGNGTTISAARYTV
jgi:murein DD-endopeptidase MepM/ murein hydrolase activator NlpD